MKQLYIIVLFCLAQLTAYSQYDIKVLDKQTHEPVVSATVYFPDMKTETSTDESGIFFIDTKVNSVLVQISSINYKTFLGILKLQHDSLEVYLEPSSHSLQEITVLASSSKLQGENVINVESVNLKSNPLMQGVSLTQKLSGVAGVSSLSTGVGIGKPVVRGFTGNRVAVFSQGVRVENQQWGDEHGLGLDENGYEQVEVIKGPASLLYGSDALGGVLYFVDERFARDNSMNIAMNSEYNTNTEGWRNNGSLKLSKGKFHWNLFGGNTTHKDYKDGNNDFVTNSRFHTTDMKTSLGYRSNKFITSLKYNYLNEKYGLTDAESADSTDVVYTNGRNPELPYQNLITHLISSENSLFFNNNSKLKIDLGYIFNNRKEFEEHAHEHPEDPVGEAALNMDLSTLSYNAKWISPETDSKWSWIFGSQGMYQVNKNKGEEILVPDAETTDFGVYTTTDYHYTEDSYWQAGLRLDGRNIDGDDFSKTYTAFNFSTGIFQQLPYNCSLRASLSSGYRAPNMFELLSDGVHEGTNRYEIGNQDLTTENCYQIDFSVNYQTTHLELFVNPFFNYIKNYIFLQPTGDFKEDLPIYIYNQTDAYLFGGEAGFHFHPHPLDWLHLQASYSSTYGQDKKNNDLPLMPSSKINSIINANFSGNKKIHQFSVFLQYQYSFEQNRVAQYEIPTDAYSLVNAGIYLELKLNKCRLLLNASVNNLFDKCYYDHLSRYKTEGIYNMGRNFVFKIGIPINTLSLL